MNILLKQRLVGAIVLISLAVIFLPMLFTGQDEQEKKFESSIPPEPVYEIKSPQVSVPLPLPAKTLEKVPLREPIAQEKPTEAIPEAANLTKQAEQAANPPAQTPQPVMVVKPAIKPDIKPQSIDAPTPTSQPDSKPALTPSQTPSQTSSQTPAEPAQAAPVQAAAIKPSDVTGWVVQVGSFSRQPNARKLRDKLRKMGMASFVVTGVSDNKTVYRVRVGPEINRADAEKIQATIKKKTNLSGLVMKYP